MGQEWPRQTGPKRVLWMDREKVNPIMGHTIGGEKFPALRNKNLAHPAYVLKIRLVKVKLKVGDACLDQN